uniref:Protein krueppel n=1 Tax=Glossina brevipalpis TaxID=37001 RepID=A0A1A9WLE2_9MUSC
MFIKDFKELRCRTCLRESTESKGKKMYQIFETADFARKLTLCCALELDPLDEFPQYVCSTCYEKILDFYEFKLMCSNSMQKYKETLNKIQNSTEIKQEGEPNQLYEDEKPLYGLHEQPQVELVEIKSDVLLQDDVPVEETTEIEIIGKKRGKAPRKQVVDKKAVTVEDAKRPRHETRVKKKCGKKQIINSVNKEEVKQLGNEKVKEQEFVPTVKASKKTATTKRVYKCDLCEARFFVEHRLIAHKRKHEGLSPYPCTIEGCDRSYNRLHNLEQHLKDHKGDRPRRYKCDVENCDRAYKTKSAINMHKRKTHHLGPALKKHICEICGKIFKTSASLNDHRFSHKSEAELPFACEETNCNRRFSNKAKLQVHKMRHAGIKNFVCPHCGMRKTTRNELRTHLNYHTLKRIWPCRFCPKEFHSANNLKMHIRNMHEQAKDFACRFCERTFAKPDTRKYHEMTHTGEKPHECKECGKRFTQPAALRTHKKVHLKEIKLQAAEQNVAGLMTEQNLAEPEKLGNDMAPVF